MTIIDPLDLKVEVVNSRPPGGQYVYPNRDSWVKVTHLPTDTVVMVRDLRSQHANRDAALRMLEFFLTDPEIRR